MKKTLAMIAASLLILMQIIPVSLAENTRTWDGKVMSADPQKIVSPFTGVIEDCDFYAGTKISAGDVLMTFKTNKVYADQNGTAYTMGDAGDQMEAVIARHGAPLFIQPDYTFTISASTKSGHNLEANKFIVPGEKVYLRSSANSAHTGVGVVSQVADMNYTVEVTEGNLESNEPVNIYRDAAYTASGRIGKGFAVHVYPVPYTSAGLGRIVKFHVQDGDQVKKGDLLYETIEGTFSPSDKSHHGITLSENGTLYSLSVRKGDSVLENDPVAVFYPDSALRIEMPVPEDELNHVREGDHVLILLPGKDGEEEKIQGTVERISLVPVTQEGENAVSSYESSYAACIVPEDTSLLRYGMNVTVEIP